MRLRIAVTVAVRVQVGRAQMSDENPFDSRAYLAIQATGNPPIDQIVTVMDTPFGVGEACELWNTCTT